MTFVIWENLFKLSSIKAQQPNFTYTMTWCGATTRAETFHGDYFVIISNLAMWNMKLWCDNNKKRNNRRWDATQKERKWTISFSMMIRRIVGEEEENLFFHLSPNAISLYLILSFKQPWKLNKKKSEKKVRDDEIRENINKSKMEHESRIKVMGYIKSLVLDHRPYLLIMKTLEKPERWGDEKPENTLHRKNNENNETRWKPLTVNGGWRFN